MGKREREEDDGEYNSTSTIDNPPKGLGKDDDGNEESGASPDERVFDVELSVKLKPVGGKAATWPLLVDEIRGALVMQHLEAALKLPANIEVVEAMLRNPNQHTRKSSGNQEEMDL